MAQGLNDPEIRSSNFEGDWLLALILAKIELCSFPIPPFASDFSLIYPGSKVTWQTVAGGTGFSPDYIHCICSSCPGAQLTSHPTAYRHGLGDPSQPGEASLAPSGRKPVPGMQYE